MDSRRAAHSSPSAPPTHAVRRPRGVRRRRDDNAAALEIEELDSDVMRQNSYNYFQRHGVRLGDDAPANPNEAGNGTASGRKRQRTLAEQLEDLSLHAGGAQRSASAMSGAAAAAACRQAWNRIFASQMAAAQQRAAAEKAAKAAREAAAAAPVVAASGADVDMDGLSAADDGDLGDAEDDDESGRDSGSFKVFGGVPDVKDMFFNQGTARQRPMERMFRHYVTMAAERSSRTDSGAPRGDELVLFQQGPTSLEFPYSLFTPEQVEDLRARHNRKKKRQGAASDRGFARSMFGSAPGSGSPAGGFTSDQSWRFQELDSSDEADVSSSAEDSDMDMSGDGEAKAPQLAGALSHGEWFVEDDDDDSDSTL